jgi:hypothetical protein
MCTLSIALDRPRPTLAPRYHTGGLETYSHSIINERSKLLIRKAIASASQTSTVIFPVNPSGTSIGVGLRAVLRKLTFRDLSRSIDSWGARERFIAP